MEETRITSNEVTGGSGVVGVVAIELAPSGYETDPDRPNVEPVGRPPGVPFDADPYWYECCFATGDTRGGSVSGGSSEFDMLISTISGLSPDRLVGVDWPPVGVEHPGVDGPDGIVDASIDGHLGVKMPNDAALRDVLARAPRTPLLPYPCGGTPDDACAPPAPLGENEKLPRVAEVVDETLDPPLASPPRFPASVLMRARHTPASADEKLWCLLLIRPILIERVTGPMVRSGGTAAAAAMAAARASASMASFFSASTEDATEMPGADAPLDVPESPGGPPTTPVLGPAEFVTAAAAAAATAAAVVATPGAETRSSTLRLRFNIDSPSEPDAPNASWFTPVLMPTPLMPAVLEPRAVCCGFHMNPTESNFSCLSFEILPFRRA